MDNPLTTWFYSTGKIVTDSNKQNVTHFLLDGGKLDISKDYELFQEMYSKYIHCKNCIVERKTNLFKFFIDFDFNSTEIIDISGFIEVIQDVIENIYGVPHLCIVTCADKYKETIMSKIPSSRLGDPDDIANAVLFLCSNQSDYINGETLHVNGGMYMA